MDIQALMEAATRAHRAGRLEQAQVLYTKVIAKDPNHAEALHLSGVLSHQAGDSRAGIPLIEKAIQLDPHRPVYHHNLGLLLTAIGHADKAETCYLHALAHNPENVQSWYNLGNLHHSCGRLQKALMCYRKALSLKADHLDAWNNLAAVYLDQGQADEAVKCCRHLISLNAGYAPAYTNLGNALRVKGDFDQAVAIFEKAIALNPDNAVCHTNLAHAWLETGRADLAVASFRKAIDRDPLNADAWGGMGVALRKCGRLKEGIAYLKKSIELMPGNHESYQNLGNIHLALNEPEKALACYRQAMGIRPRDPSLQLCMGLAWSELGCRDEALQAYEQAVHYDPEYEKAWVYLAHAFQETCDWRNLENIAPIVDRMTRRALQQQKRPEEMPFFNIARHDDPALNHQVAAAWSAEIAKQYPGPRSHFPPAAMRRGRQRITIGYLSNNFRNHPTAHLISGIFDLHDRNRFDIYCYSYGENDGSSYRQQIEGSADRFVDLSGMDHLQSAARIHRDGVNILVDLVGYMRNARIEIAALRPAPVQVRWLGMAGTTGAAFYDYIVAHTLAIPAEEASCYSEHLVYLPNCYQVNNNRQTVAEDTVTRKEEGLPESAFVLCCFCTHYKIDRPVFECWMRILKNCPQSVLWLLNGGKLTCTHLKAAAKEMGVDPSRLVFADKVARERHLKRLGLADLGVDTWKVNGAATTSDALWAGVPVVTRQGRHFASRMSANILTALEMPDLVEADVRAYESRILRYCNDPDQLNQLKAILRHKKMTAPLFDTPRFVGHLEAAYVKMWDNYLSGREPSQIKILK